MSGVAVNMVQMESSIDPIAEALAHGWALTPLNGKRPIRDGWQDEDPLSESELQRHKGNFGLRTGSVSGVSVVDVDEGADPAFVESLPVTWTVRTGSSNLHLYYRHSDVAEELGNKVRIRPGVDIRTSRGQVVFVGSVHPDTGGVYEWEPGKGPQEIRLADWPEHILKKPEVKPKRGKSRKPRPLTSNKQGREKYAAIALDSQCANVRNAMDGKRNNTLNIAAFKVGQLAHYGLDHDAAKSALFDAALDCGLGESESRKTIESGFAKGLVCPKELEDRKAKRIRRRKGGLSINPDVVDPAQIVEDSRPMRLAELFLDRKYGGRGAGQRLRRYLGAWWVWREGAYREVSDEVITAELARFLDGLFQRGQDSFGNEVLQPVKNSKNARSEVLAALSAVGGILDGTMPFWIDGRSEPDPRHVVAFLDKLYHLPSETVYQASPLFFSGTTLPFTYAEERSPCPEWLAFLGQVFEGDAESIQTLREWFGYCLTADTRYQKMLFIHGPRRSGKGTIARILAELIGAENVAGPTLAGLSANFGLAPLLGKSLAIVSDARLSGKTDQAIVTERLLSISGEDRITVDRKFVAPVTTTLPTRIMILSNELPRFHDSSAALAGRFIMLSMRQSFYGQEDTELGERLRSELPGILAWAMDGWHRLTERGRFMEPQRSADLIADLEAYGNPVGSFLAECTKEVPGRITFDDLYTAWCNWCERNGRQYTGNKQAFGRELRTARPELVITQPRLGAGRVRCVEGISLLAQGENQ